MKVVLLTNGDVEYLLKLVKQEARDTVACLQRAEERMAVPYRNLAAIESNKKFIKARTKRLIDQTKLHEKLMEANASEDIKKGDGNGRTGN